MKLAIVYFASSSSLLASAFTPTSINRARPFVPTVGRYLSASTIDSPTTSSTSTGFDKDDYQWPNMYREADSMLDVATLMYGYASVRELAKENSEYEEILELPQTVQEIGKFIAENQDALQAYLTEDGKKDNSEASVPYDCINSIIARSGKTEESESEVVYFEDELADKELVYGIGINKKMKRIDVAFRGTVTTTDMITDARKIFVPLDNPVKQIGGPDEIFWHKGFHNYLFGDVDKDNISKCDEIIQKVKEQVEIYPGYKVYVTGHSLGGALSTMFAFMLAAADGIPKPVTNVSVASPYCGDQYWRDAFQACEREGIIRHLRLANYKDAVPLFWVFNPLQSIRYLRPMQYKHVGLQLKVYENKLLSDYPYELNYNKGFANECRMALDNGIVLAEILAITLGRVVKVLTVPDLSWARKVRDMKKAFEAVETILGHHACSEYSERLDLSKEVLQTMYVNTEYEKKLAEPEN